MNTQAISEFIEFFEQHVDTSSWLFDTSIEREPRSKRVRQLNVHATPPPHLVRTEFVATSSLEVPLYGSSLLVRGYAYDVSGRTTGTVLVLTDQSDALTALKYALFSAFLSMIDQQFSRHLAHKQGELLWADVTKGGKKGALA